jgi:hypothetical protein
MTKRGFIRPRPAHRAARAAPWPRAHGEEALEIGRRG